MPDINHDTYDHTGIPGVGGSSATHSYLGKTSVGANTESSVAHTWYVKQISAPADGIIETIGVHWTGTANGATPVWQAAVWADSGSNVPSGPPLFVGGAATFGVDTVSDGDAEAAAWVQMPCGLYVASGTEVWIGMQPSTTTALLSLDTTGGTDYTWDHAATVAMGVGYVTATSTSKDYNIRAGFLSL